MSIILGSGTGGNGITINSLLGTSGQYITSGSALGPNYPSWQNFSYSNQSKVWTFITAATAFGSATINFSLPSNSTYVVTFANVKPSNAGTYLKLRFGNPTLYTNNYAGTVSGISNYSTSGAPYTQFSIGGTSGYPSTDIPITRSYLGYTNNPIGYPNSSTSIGLNGYLFVNTSTSKPEVYGQFTAQTEYFTSTSTNTINSSVGGRIVAGRTVAGNVNYLSFSMSAGNIASGVFRLYQTL